MTIKRLIQLVCAGITLGVLKTASAVSISMAPTDVTLSAGDTAEIEVFGDFSDDPTVGGGFDIIFDPSSVQILDVVQEPIGDPDFLSIGPINNVTGVVSSVAFGDFGGISGTFLIATISLQYLGGGETSLFMQDNAGMVGPFFSAATFQQQAVAYTGTTIMQPIPLPATAVLMIGGLAALLGFGRAEH